MNFQELILIKQVIFLILFFFLFVPAALKEMGQQALSPRTTIAASDKKKTDRMHLVSLPELADKKRNSVNSTLFQKGDIEGIYPIKWDNQNPNLAQEEAFLIAEAIAYTYKSHLKETQSELAPKQNPNGIGRVLITRDHLVISKILAHAVEVGALIQGFKVDYHSSPLPTGVAHFYGLDKNYDITFHVTGSDKIILRNKIKISVRQNKEGKFDPDGKLKDFNNHQEKPIAEMIRDQADDIMRARNNEALRHSQNPKTLENETMMAPYITALKNRFGRLQTSRRLVIFANDAINSALIPILKNQGHIIEKKKSQSLSEACQTLKKINSEKTNETPLALGVVIDEAGESIHLIDEEGGIIPSSALATLVYQDFISKNEKTLKEQNISVTLALDANLVQIGNASAIESLASLLNQDKTALNNANIGAVYISSNFFSAYRRHIAQEIEKLRELKQKIRKTDPNALALCSKITDIINSFVIMESSGHYFSVTDLDRFHDSLATDDGIFWAARLLEILDTKNIPIADKKQQQVTYLMEISI